MIPILASLFEHQAWADAALIRAVGAHPGAWQDEEIRKMLHHILIVQRFFPLRIRDLAFDMESEMRESDTLAALAERFRAAHAFETETLTLLEDDALTRRLELPRFQFQPTVGEALTQIVLHSQGHRGQCLTRLRVLGATPPLLDYILWTNGRPAPDWS